jgi:hypothetical protein
MKTLSLFCLMSAMIFICGCDNKPRQIVDETVDREKHDGKNGNEGKDEDLEGREIGKTYVGPRFYDLEIGFRNAAGTDLVKGIPNSASEWTGVDSHEGGAFATVDHAAYECGEPDMDVKQPKPDPTFISGYTWKIGLSRFDGYQCLSFGEVSSQGLDPVGRMTHKLTCRHIFGDDEQHTIVSYWKPREDSNESWILPDGTSAENDCYRVTVDGVEFTAVRKTAGYGVYCVVQAVL